AVACGRSLIAGVFYLLILRPRVRDARWTTAIAYAGCIVTFVSATKLTTAANAIFLQYTGPAYCRKIAFAAVVSLVAETNVTMHPAYAIAVVHRASRTRGRRMSR